MSHYRLNGSLASLHLNGPISESISGIIDSYISIWESQPTEFPKFECIYNENEKSQNGQNFEVLVRQLRNNKENIFKSEAAKNRAVSSLKVFTHKALKISQRDLGVVFSDDFVSTTLDFYERAKEFDQNLSNDDIYKACRNVWTAAGIRIILGKKVNLSPSIFAFSLLYPYSDNLLDNPKISKLQKVIFNKRFSKRLRGDNIKPSSRLESKIFELIELIEGQYPREINPAIYHCLLAMHKAQIESTKLLNDSRLRRDEVIRICFIKGGLSGLTNAYLVSGEVDNKIARLMLGFGVYLQLIDDLQDIIEDSSAGLKTTFTIIESPEELKKAVNRLFYFGRGLRREMSILTGEEIERFKSVSFRFTEILLIDAVNRSQARFNGHYIQKLGKAFPFYFSFLKKDDTIRALFADSISTISLD